MQVKLSTILNNMNSFQTMQTIEEPTKVRFIDLALKNDSPSYKLPFRVKQTTLRVFDGITHYAFPADYDEMSYVDNNNVQYADRAHFKFQSYNEFEEDKDYRNDLAEIYDDGEVYLGCRYKASKAGSVQIDNAETLANYTVSGDASNAALDNVFFNEGNGSIRFTVVLSTGTATIENSFTSMSDSLYTRKYVFRKIYLSGVPDAITLRFGNDSSNYLYEASITTQFDGQALKANAWNLVAFDLNTAVTVGTISSTAFDYQAIIMTNAPTGTYYIDTAYLRGWELLDNFWYFTKNSVKTSAGVGKETFIDASTEDYDTTDGLVGPVEWSNFIMYRAMILALADKQDDPLYTKVAGVSGTSTSPAQLGFAKESENKLKERYPMVKPLITNSNYRFRNNLMSGYDRQFNQKN